MLDFDAIVTVLERAERFPMTADCLQRKLARLGVWAEIEVCVVLVGG